MLTIFLKSLIYPVWVIRWRPIPALSWNRLDDKRNFMM